jgi:hypothetical protein
MKIEIAKPRINPFGGLNFVVKEIKKKGITQLIDSELGERQIQSKYQYSDIFMALWLIFFSGGDCAEDIEEHLEDCFLRLPGVKVPSADTILRVQKELSTEKQNYISNQGIAHEFNINLAMNKLNVKMLLQLGLLKSNQEYDFDYDNQLIPTEKYDSKLSYKMKKGYFPGIATINDMPVYIENRNGNSNVKYLQEETLERAYHILLAESIKINRSRMDCGSYSKKIVFIVEKYSKLFYIRAQKCADLEERVREIENWEKVQINHKNYEVASIEYFPFGSVEKHYRLVIMREPNKTGQTNLFTGDAMKYRSILTNDWQTTEKDIIEYYNQRGRSEKVFDVMNNDFGWSKMPFSFMNENTVFLIAMAMCMNFYKYLIEKFSKTFKFLKKNFRLKKFIFRFIVVASKWIKQGRQNTLKLYTNKPYQLALF